MFQPSALAPDPPYEAHKDPSFHLSSCSLANCILRDKKQQVAGGFSIEDQTSIANNKKSGAKTQAKVLSKLCFFLFLMLLRDGKKTYKRASSACVNFFLFWVKSKFCILRDKK